ncbi:MAG TPA: hypothetical protein VM422_03600, partial [Amaricoccus sp.]|nr:hypothetical protein [Amaricoccus sp.]
MGAGSFHRQENGPRQAQRRGLGNRRGHARAGASKALTSLGFPKARRQPHCTLLMRFAASTRTVV